MDLSSDFLVVIAAIYLEKYLLTVLGFVSFGVLLPAGCAVIAVGALCWRAPIMRVGAKIALFAVLSVLLVPSSVWVSSMIEKTYESSIAATMDAAEQTTSTIENAAEQSAQGEGDESNAILSWLSSVKGGINKLTEDARASLGNFIEALAVMIVTSCVIPIVVLLFFAWLLRTILGVDFELPRRRR